MLKPRNRRTETISGIVPIFEGTFFTRGMQTSVCGVLKQTVKVK